MTIGDVFSIVATIFGIFLTSWATVVAVALLMPNAAERARRAVDQPKLALWRGVFLTVPMLLVGIVLLSMPLPVAKLAGWLVTLAWMSLGAIGASGLAQAAGNRIQNLDSRLGAYASLCRGAAYVVGAGILPVLGWFAFGPLMILASVGAGFTAVRSAAESSRTGEVV